MGQLLLLLDDVVEPEDSKSCLFYIVGGVFNGIATINIVLDTDGKSLFISNFLFHFHFLLLDLGCGLFFGSGLLFLNEGSNINHLDLVVEVEQGILTEFRELGDKPLADGGIA